MSKETAHKCGVKVRSTFVHYSNKILSVVDESRLFHSDQEVSCKFYYNHKLPSTFLMNLLHFQIQFLSVQHPY